MQFSNRFFALTMPWLMAGAAVAFWFLSLNPVGLVYAADIIINPGDSIQAAIDGANPGDTIILNAGVYIDSSFTLSKAVRIHGAGADQTIIYANPAQRVMTVTGMINAATTISGVQLTGGRLLSMTTGCPAFCGGGVYLTNNARPFLNNVVISDSIASGNGGGLYIEGIDFLALDTVQFINNHSEAGRGGGLYSVATLYVQASTFIDNSALVHGGGLFSLESVTTVSSTLTNNYALDQRGGAIYADKGWTDESSTLTNNRSFLGGGAVYANVQALIEGTELRNNEVISGNGGAIYAVGPLAATDVVLADNSAVQRGGAIYADKGVALTNVALWGNHADLNGGGLYANGTGANVANLQATTFMSNTSTARGGAAYFRGTTSITEGVVQGNQAGDHGGGIFAEGALTVAGPASFVGNQAVGNGGAIYASGNTSLTEFNAALNEATQGGGVYASAEFALYRSAVGGNVAASNGGGLYLSGLATLENNLFVGNNTLGNGESVYYAGGIETLTAVHNTIASPTPVSGAAIYVNSGTALITNTILANHSSGLAQTGSSVVAEDYNLFHNLGLTSTGTVSSGGNSFFGNPLFVDLANGDAALMADSPAIDAAVDLGISEDLLGNPRPGGQTTLPDIGATEWQGYQADLQIALEAAPEPVIYGQALTYTLTITNAGPDETAEITTTLELPAEISDVVVIQSGAWACETAALPLVTCTLTDTLAANTTNQIVLTATAPLWAGVYTSTATVTTTAALDPIPANNTATITTTVIRYDIYLPLITR